MIKILVASAKWAPQSPDVSKVLANRNQSHNVLCFTRTLLWAQHLYANFLVALYGGTLQAGDHAQKGLAYYLRYKRLEGDLSTIDYDPRFEL